MYVCTYVYRSWKEKTKKKSLVCEKHFSPKKKKTQAKKNSLCVRIFKKNVGGFFSTPQADGKKKKKGKVPTGFPQLTRYQPTQCSPN